MKRVNKSAQTADTSGNSKHQNELIAATDMATL
jgi:hypothetical protein